jgi:integrase
LESRIDVADHTRLQHRSDVNRAESLLDHRVDEITAADVAELVARLAETRKRETVRKTVLALGMVFDHAGIDPNPARDKRTVKLPKETRVEIKPPTADHVLAVHRLLPERYRLPLLVLDDTGMRLSELERLEWGDMDEPEGRWRVSASVSKTGKARWVKITPSVFGAVLDLCPRDDRVPERRVFQGFGGDRFRTAISRACTASGVPAFSPHDLRHRRISLLLREEDPVTVSRLVGHAKASMSLDVYGHVLLDEAEIDYAEALA